MFVFHVTNFVDVSLSLFVRQIAEVWEGVIVQLHCRDIVSAESNSEVSAARDGETSAEPVVVSPIASYSVKLIPICLNEIGDGFDLEQHENAVKGNIVAEKLTRSKVSSPIPGQHGTPRTPRRLDSFSLKKVPTSPLTLGRSAHHSSLNDQSTLLSSQSSFKSGETISRLPLPAKPKPVVSPEALAEMYDLHLATRGLPKLASRTQAIAILRRIQDLSKEWGTVIQIDDPFPDAHDESVGVVGWVSKPSAIPTIQTALTPIRANVSNVPSLNAEVIQL